MSSPTKEQVLTQLKKVMGPDLKNNIVDLGIVSEVFIADGKVMFSLSVPADQASTLEPLRVAAEKAVLELTGVKGAMVALTAEKKGGDNATSSPPPTAPKSAQPSGQSTAKPAVPGIKQIIAVASGKGGVGKSTTSVNLALAFAANGLKVGILDADIYGPSMPRLMGIKGKPEQTGEKMLKPMERYGIKVMSMGFLVDEDTPMIWRGPMVISALTQMLREVEWGDLDLLVVDMPPGTGDAQLTMAQSVPLAGAVIVSTPQDLALIDARKGLNMFKRTEVPLLGIVENMSFFVCPKCGDQHNIFGNGGAQAEAEKIGVPFLGAVPLHMDIRSNSDEGTPVVTSDADGVHALTYRAIAAKVQEQLGLVEEASVSTNIVFD